MRHSILLFLSLFTSFAFTVSSVCFSEELKIESEAKEEVIPDYLTTMSLEELMDVKVVSAAKKETTIFNTAAAVYVITQEDIRRSGVTTVAEALRMAPGIHVARLDSNTWAVSARGFNQEFSNKLLVMVDGRSIYSPTFSGVYWEQLDTLLEDIDRIEVIRGPGGTVWGANAVNGVINIITKNSKDTYGGLVSAGAGDEERGFANFRYGMKLSEEASLRVYGKYFQRDDFEGVSDPAADDWRAGQGGFRADWDVSENNSLTISGDYRSGHSGNRAKNRVVSITAPTTESVDEDIRGVVGNFMAKWVHKLKPKSEIIAQAYFHREERHFEKNGLSLITNNYDLDFQHHFFAGEKHEIVWGLGQRFVVDTMDDSFNIAFTPDSQLNYRTSAFVQDEIQLIPEKLSLTLGSKFEVNNFTGFEIQPSVRLLWTPTESQSAWIAVSRAVRTPSRAEDSVLIKNRTFSIMGLTAIAEFQGNPKFESEDLTAFEAGYRIQPTDHIFFDVTGFYNFYNQLLTLEPQAPVLNMSTMPPHFTISGLASNLGSGESFGIELSSQWEVSSWLKLTAGFSWLELDLTNRAISSDTSLARQEQVNPEVIWHIRSYLDLPYHFELDSALYHVNSMEKQGIPAYTRLDVRLGWNPIESIELSIIGQNLQDTHHPEFSGGLVQFNATTEVERSVFGKITWKFN